MFFVFFFDTQDHIPQTSMCVRTGEHTREVCGSCDKSVDVNDNVVRTTTGQMHHLECHLCDHAKHSQSDQCVGDSNRKRVRRSMSIEDEFKAVLVHNEMLDGLVDMTPEKRRKNAAARKAP